MVGEVPSPITRICLDQDEPGWRPWSATAQNFVQHQLSHTVNFWQQRRPAVFHLESLSGGRVVLNLTFQLPPSKSSPNSTTPSTPTSTAPPPKCPIIPLFPPGEVPNFHPRKPPVKLSSKVQKPYRRSVLHQASQATPNLSPALPGTLRWKCAKLLPSHLRPRNAPVPLLI